MRVKSKIDWWYKLIIWFVILSMLFGLVTVQDKEKLIGYIVTTLMIVFLLWLYYGTYYEMRESYLYCRCGPFFEKIPYDKVKSLRLSHNMLSSMALSIDRIEIRQHGKGYFSGTTYISPVNREDFMGELKSRCYNCKET